MSKCALPAFSHWLIILQTHSAAKTLVDHRGFRKGWNLSSLSDVNTDTSSPLAVSSSWVVSIDATVLKSVFRIQREKTKHNILSYCNWNLQKEISSKSTSNFKFMMTASNLGILKQMLEFKYNETVNIWLILLAGRQDRYCKSKLRTAVKEAKEKTLLK